MSIFRGFITYDYGREYFAFFIKRGFDICEKWFKIRGELEKKLQEMKKNPQEIFEMESDYGNFVCSYEKQTKWYFIMLSNTQTIKEEQNKVLQAVVEQIKKVNNYFKLTREELQNKLKQNIEDILNNFEQEYIKKNGNLDQIMTQQSQQKKRFRMDLVKQIENKKHQQQKTINLIEKAIKSKISIAIPQQKIMFKGFMMFDYVRQYFFMMINKMKSTQNKWIDDRNAIYKQIMDNSKKPSDIIQLKGEDGQFYAKFHKEKKCYFILYSDVLVSVDKQKDIVEKIFQLITQTSYIKMIKEEIELKFQQQVRMILDENEKIDIEQIIMNLEGKNDNNKLQTDSPKLQSEINEVQKSNITGSLNNPPKNNLYIQEENQPLKQ